MEFCLAIGVGVWVGVGVTGGEGILGAISTGDKYTAVPATGINILSLFVLELTRIILTKLSSKNTLNKNAFLI